MKLTAPRVCDLCHRQQPSLYCSSDSAFLCADCDSQVHSANFLVARHIRVSLCSLCKSHHSNPRSCHVDDNDDALSSSSSSSCISSTSNNSKAASTVVVSSSSDWKTRDVLADWCRRVGGGSASDVIIEVARRVWWRERRWVWPYRVGLAAALWFGLLRFTKDDGAGKRRIRLRSLLKNLEEISGVPAKSIVLAESKLASALKTRIKHRQPPLGDEESWAEC